MTVNWDERLRTRGTSKRGENLFPASKEVDVVRREEDACIGTSTFFDDLWPSAMETMQDIRQTHHLPVAIAISD